jgi:hypothetical protein
LGFAGKIKDKFNKPENGKQDLYLDSLNNEDDDCTDASLEEFR